MGVNAFSPFEHIIEMRTISRKRGTQRKVEYDRPVFSRYLFADCNDMPMLKGVHLVQGVIADENGMLTIPVRGRFAELVELSQGGHALSKLDLTRLSMGFAGKVGDMFTFIGGGFEGHRGKILSLDRLDSHGEVMTQVHMLGAIREIPVAHDQVGSVVKQDDHPRVEMAA